MNYVYGLFIATTLCFSAAAQTKMEWKGYRIIETDTLPVKFSLTKIDSLVKGTAKYTHGSKYYVIYNIEGKILPDGSVELMDSYVEDKLMPIGCDFYGKYYLKTSSDSSLLTGIWTEPPPCGVTLRKKESGRIFVTMDSHMDVDSMLFAVTVRERRDSIAKVIHSTNKTVRVEITDNAQIDDDRISVFYNGVLLLKNQRISSTPITLSFDIDSNRSESLLRVVAENLGKIPPNTTRVRVITGESDESMIVSSSFDHNGVIQFKLTK